MVEKIIMAKNPDAELYTHFVIRMPPEEADALLVEHAAYKMRLRLAEQRHKGFAGWNTPQVTNEDLLFRLLKNAGCGNYVDALNLAAMLLARQDLFEEVPFP